MLHQLPIIVIGAGAAGIYAAYHLQHVHGLKAEEVVVVEASQYVGGRVKQDPSFAASASHILELGGELVHGDNTLLAKLVKQLNLTYSDDFDIFNLGGRKREVREYFYLGRERRLIPIRAHQDEGVHMLYRLAAQLADNPLKDKDDVTLLQWFVNNGLPFRILGIADSLYAKTWGTTLDKLSGSQFGAEQAAALPGEGHGNLLVKNSFAPVFQFLQKDLNIITGWEAKRIDYTDPTCVRVTNSKNEVLVGRQVIVTVPLKILQDGDIEFVPPLPSAKQKAINSLIMEAGMKIFLKFSKAFWPDHHRAVICGDTPIPQFWTYGQSIPVITGFLTGEQAQLLSDTRSQNQIAQIFVKQLDTIYSTDDNRQPASDAFVDFKIQDWTKERFIRGSYSAPQVHSEGARIELAKPVGKVLFFAGEATNMNAAATIHGAMVSGRRAADEAIAAAKHKTARL
jgi:monoamine oxidase